MRRIRTSEELPETIADKENQTLGNEKQKEVRSAHDDDSKCVVCIDAKKCVAIMPCKHMCVCEECIELLKTCPICRIDIESCLLLYV